MEGIIVRIIFIGYILFKEYLIATIPNGKNAMLEAFAVINKHILFVIVYLTRFESFSIFIVLIPMTSEALVKPTIFAMKFRII